MNMYIHMHIYVCLRKKKILIFSTTWINLEDVMLREISQGPGAVDSSASQ